MVVLTCCKFSYLFYDINCQKAWITEPVPILQVGYQLEQINDHWYTIWNKYIVSFRWNIVVRVLPECASHGKHSVNWQPYLCPQWPCHVTEPDVIYLPCCRRVSCAPCHCCVSLTYPPSRQPCLCTSCDWPLRYGGHLIEHLSSNTAVIMWKNQDIGHVLYWSELMFKWRLCDVLKTLIHKNMNSLWLGFTWKLQYSIKWHN